MAYMVPIISAATTGAVVAAHHQQLMAEERTNGYVHERRSRGGLGVQDRARQFGCLSQARGVAQVAEGRGGRRLVTMVEKFDDSRIRFKRLRSAREQDAYLPEGVDVYRTQLGGAGVLVRRCGRRRRAPGRICAGIHRAAGGVG